MLHGVSYLVSYLLVVQSVSQLVSEVITKKQFDYISALYFKENEGEGQALLLI